jgi:uncharacterized protein YaiI (UPF0178 family)
LARDPNLGKSRDYKMAKHKPNTIWIDADACPRAVKEFYDAGSIRGGPAAFGPKDLKLFADSLNKLCS